MRKKDSNPHNTSQSRRCYHYTIPHQALCYRLSALLLYRLQSVLSTLFLNFFIIFFTRAFPAPSAWPLRPDDSGCPALPPLTPFLRLASQRHSVRSFIPTDFFSFHALPAASSGRAGSISARARTPLAKFPCRPLAFPAKFHYNYAYEFIKEGATING